MSNYAQPYYAHAPLGQAAPLPATSSSSSLQIPSSPQMTVLRVASVAAMGALAYHGYRRTGSWGWALAWGIGGGLVWPIALAVAIAQGYGKAPMRRNRKRSRR